MHQVVDFDFLEWDGPFEVLDDLDGAAEPAQPGGHIAGIGHGPRKEQELQGGRGREQHALVVVAAVGVGEPVIFVDDEQLESRCPDVAGREADDGGGSG